MYEKQTWNTGDIITEDKLNHIEDGIASCGMFVVGSTYDESTQTETLDKTYKEIKDAVEAGRNVVQKKEQNDDGDSFTALFFLTVIGNDNGNYYVDFVKLSSTGNSVTSFLADSENGYPSYTVTD